MYNLFINYINFKRNVGIYVNFKILLVLTFFMILISIQFTLNLILKELRDIKRIIIKEKNTKMKEDIKCWDRQTNE